MRLECYNNRFCQILFGRLNQPLKDLLVAPMHPIKYTNGYNRSFGRMEIGNGSVDPQRSNILKVSENYAFINSLSTR